MSKVWKCGACNRKLGAVTKHSEEHSSIEFAKPVSEVFEVDKKGFHDHIACPQCGELNRIPC
jgi:predicted nucleic-acid-binding Zn-ribbon protein